MLASTSCFATAGSGKTHWLAQQALDLNKSGTPYLAVTFTKAAAEVLTTRLSPPPECKISTLHAYAYSKLPNFLMPSSSFSPSLDKGFRNLLLETASLSFTPPPYILLDEAQDLSGEMYTFLRSMCLRGSKLVQVGDPNQSIYGFMGGSPDYMTSLHQEFCTDTYELLVNRRSSNQIVGSANRLLDLEAVGTFEGPPVQYFEINRLTDFIPPEGFTCLVEDRYISPIWYLENDPGTIHSAKGLEYDKVLLILRSRGRRTELRRVAYVGYTRAKLELQVVVVRRTSHG